MKLEPVDNPEKSFGFSWTAHIQRVGQKFQGVPDMAKKKQKIDLDKLELLRSRMIAKPIKEKIEFNDGETIKMLAAEIYQLIEKGYTFVDIAAMVAEVDASISPSTIAASLRSASKVSADNKKRAKGTGKSLIAKLTNRSEAVVLPKAIVNASVMVVGENTAGLAIALHNTPVCADTARALSSELESHGLEVQKDNGISSDDTVVVENAQRLTLSELQGSNDPRLPIDEDNQETPSFEWELEAE
jgi:hypothetical protein